MSDPRLPPRRDQRQPWARFRCPTCHRFVVASAHGVCPRCGLPPPAPLVTGPRDEQIWARVAGAPGRPRWTYFALVALVSLALGALLSAWALGLL
jgi:hypothetical protein